MFLSTLEQPQLSQAGLHGFAASSNTPVVEVDELPVAPARAAIAVYADDQGGLRLVVALRSLEARRVAFFAYQEEVDPTSSVEEIINIALSFGESMGFSFDAEMIAGDASGRRRAIRHWQELVDDFGADDSLGNPSLLAGEDDLLDGDEELLLEELVPSGERGDRLARDELDLALDDTDFGDFGELGELDDDSDFESEATPAAAPQPRIRPEPPLSKFRLAPKSRVVPASVVASAKTVEVISGTSGRGADDEMGPSELGRIPILRVRLEGGRDRPSLLMRLLTSF